MVIKTILCKLKNFNYSAIFSDKAYSMTANLVIDNELYLNIFLNTIKE